MVTKLPNQTHPEAATQTRCHGWFVFIWRLHMVVICVQNMEMKRKFVNKDSNKSYVPLKKVKKGEPDDEQKPDQSTKTAEDKHKKAKEEQTLSKSLLDTSVSWNAEEVIASHLGVPVWAARNAVRLLDEGCTVPFITRYRKEQTGGMEAQIIRETLTLLEELRAVETKVKAAKEHISEKGKLTVELEKALSHAHTLQEVECLFAPFKTGSKGTLAERARSLGLEPLAVLFSKGFGTNAEAAKLVQHDTKDLGSVKEVLEGVKHIIADMIHKDPEIMELVRSLSRKSPVIQLHSTKSKAKKSEPKPGTKPEPEHKYETYFEFQRSAAAMQPHQTLAINRGESHKILAVKVDIPKKLEFDIKSRCLFKWRVCNMNQDSATVFTDAVEDALSRLIIPQITRNVRSELTKEAEKSSIDVFSKNLKHLLLTAPLKGSIILALDPGFSHGCKTAIISVTGQILATQIVWLHGKPNERINQLSVLEGLIHTHKVEIVAIGNGVACRETESVVSGLIKKSFPSLKYCIVSECGASIYSVSDVAKAEMPDLDPSLRGAVSIGRRLLDPLAEFVKVDPKHLGVGQYQHDMPQSQLKKALDLTVEECVSFVGVDINTCSQCLLSRVSGLTASKVKKVLEWREKFGPFICREQLLSVKGLGEKTYEQAAGFVRIHSLNNEDFKNLSPLKAASRKGKGKKKPVAEYKPNPLDMTEIHPESYEAAQKFITMASLSLKDLGQPDFIKKIGHFMSSIKSLEELAGRLSVGVPTVTLIATALQRPLTYDLREGFDKPLFKQNITDMNQLQKGQRVTGKVNNVTHFGAFVDIGVGKDAMVHNSNMRLKDTGRPYSLCVGETIEAEIENKDISKGRIGLRLIRLI
ncbi:S1 RNA-binding domain-containing protein 1-like isoform X2 [Dreissena polymorpha]|uniref:S1 RNA-binding domain-containing protein 1-like isoform X2 n=1 Tax=Dreissena polymorpha TaxID=45954 RepID=UPI002265260E|nr:S1 RNA-binding domain-containing protein 1-like isoform X2 [Dreissena polymorpha]